MATTTGALNPEQIDLKVKEAFATGYGKYTSTFERVFIIEEPDRRNERFTIVKTGKDVDEVSDGADAPEGVVKEIGASTISVRVYKAAIVIGDLADLFDNYGTIMKVAMSKAHHMRYKMDELGAAFLNNATSTSTPYGFTVDGTTYPLASTAQAIGDTGSTQSNRISGALDKDTSNSALVALMTQKDHDNVIFGHQLKRIVVPPQEWMNAWQLFRSPGEPESANRNDNFLNTLKPEIIYWPLLTSSTGCFFMSDKSDVGTKGLRFEVKQAPKMQRILDTGSGCWKYMFKMVLFPGVIDYQGLVTVGV